MIYSCIAFTFFFALLSVSFDLEAQDITDSLLEAPTDLVLFEEPVFDRYREHFVSKISEINLLVEPGEELEIVTANVSQGGDPALHLLKYGTKEQVAFDDSATGGPGIRLNYSGAGGVFTLVVRSRIQNAPGKTDLFKNGQAWHADVEFGGWHIAYSKLKKGEEFQTVTPPNGAVAGHVLYMLDEDNKGISFRRQGGSAGGATFFEIPDDLGSRVVLVGIDHHFSPGRVRIIRNDVGITGHDPDDDGLGSALEATLGTCEALFGSATGMDGVSFDCGLAADPRDTDGDGLRDNWETLGLLRAAESSSSGIVYEDLLLPTWGADPRHKDLFIEVDFMERSEFESSQMLLPNKAIEFAGYYQDQKDTPSALVDAFRAATLRNPDRKRGINVHLDTGREPLSLDHATIYGNWGGYTSVPPVRNANNDLEGANYKTAWIENMSPARRGIFRHILAYSTGGGSTEENSFAGAGPMNSSAVLAHEFAHAMGFGHSGPPHATGDVDPNCKPNHPSLINYAYQNSGVGFSDGLGRSSLNNAALSEWEAVSSQNVDYLNDLERIFKYWVDREFGHVDWNRDGEIAPEGTTVRAYSNFRSSGGGCEFTRYNSSLIPKAASIQSPAIARLGNRFYAFFSVLGLLFYTHSDDMGNCPVPSLSPCATWSDTESLSMDAGNGVDIVRLGQGNSAKLLVITIDSEGQVWENRLFLNENRKEIWDDPVKVAGASAATGEPSLSDLGRCKIFLSYRGSDQIVRFNSLSCADDFQSWGEEQRALDQDGNEIRMADFASPGIGRAYLNEPGLAQLYGAFADQNGILDLYRFDEETNHWDLTNLLDTKAGPIQGRPALAWVSEETNLDFPGRFYLMFLDRDNTRPFRKKEQTVRMMMSYVKVDKNVLGELTKNLRVGLYAPFDNAWNYAFGIDLFFEAGIDTNLRSLQSISINKAEKWARLEFRPKADGINDFVMTNYNDWEVMRHTLCENVVNPGGLIDVPAVNCPAD